MLAALRFVDDVVLFTEDTPKELLSHLRPDILVKGGDYRPEEVAGREYAGRVDILPFVDGYSTTGTIEKFRSMETKRHDAEAGSETEDDCYFYMLYFGDMVSITPFLEVLGEKRRVPASFW